MKLCLSCARDYRCADGIKRVTGYAGKCVDFLARSDRFQMAGTVGSATVEGGPRGWRVALVLPVGSETRKAEYLLPYSDEFPKGLDLNSPAGDSLLPWGVALVKIAEQDGQRLCEKVTG
jgi:hypothetical protein